MSKPLIRTIEHYYNGVTISEVQYGPNRSFFYPNFNGDIEFTSLEAIQGWIDGPFKLVQSQCAWMEDKLDMPKGSVFNFINNNCGLA